MSAISLEEYLSTVKIGPRQYHNKAGILSQTGGFCKTLNAKRVVISGGVKARKSVASALHSSLEKAGIPYVEYEFVGESSIENIEALNALIDSFNADLVIGVGGGKSIDTAKNSADRHNMPIITIPTVAGTCSCSSPLSIEYTNEGIYSRDYYPANNPNIVLVDPELLIHSPIVYLKSGILDSLSKWYEGHESIKGSSNADMFDKMALGISDYLFEQIMEKAEDAILANKAGKINEAFTDILNQIFFVTGVIQALGVKAVRNGIAHSVHNGLTVLPESHHLTHGEKVGYGILVQLLLREGESDTYKEYLSLCKKIDYSPLMEAMGLHIQQLEIHKIAEKVVSDPLMKRKPFDAIKSEDFEKIIKRIENVQG